MAPTLHLSSNAGHSNSPPRQILCSRIPIPKHEESSIYAVHSCTIGSCVPLGSRAVHIAMKVVSCWDYLSSSAIINDTWLKESIHALNVASPSTIRHSLPNKLPAKRYVFSPCLCIIAQCVPSGTRRIPNRVTPFCICLRLRYVICQTFLCCRPHWNKYAPTVDTVARFIPTLHHDSPPYLAPVLQLLLQDSMMISLDANEMPDRA